MMTSFVFALLSPPALEHHRFGKLLQTNSVVLKERSRWIEYYYRSVKPDVHFFEFDKDNVMQVGPAAGRELLLSFVWMQTWKRAGHRGQMRGWCVVTAALSARCCACNCRYCSS